GRIGGSGTQTRRSLVIHLPHGRIAVATVNGIAIPDSRLCREITELVRDVESDLLFNHSSRVFYFGALTGQRRTLRVDHELLYAGAMFHDLGLMPEHSSR